MTAQLMVRTRSFNLAQQSLPQVPVHMASIYTVLA